MAEPNDAFDALADNEHGMAQEHDNAPMQATSTPSINAVRENQVLDFVGTHVDGAEDDPFVAVGVVGPHAFHRVVDAGVASR